MLHAADVEALQELKKRSQQDAARRRELEEQLSKTLGLLQERTAALNAAERTLKVGSRVFRSRTPPPPLAAEWI